MKKNILKIVLIAILGILSIFTLTACFFNFIGGDAEFDFTMQEVMQNLKTGEYSLTYEITENNGSGKSVTYARLIRTDEGYYYGTATNIAFTNIKKQSVFIKNSDVDTYTRYTWNNGNYIQSGTTEYTDEEILSIAEDIVELITMYLITRESMSNDGATIILGRDCKKYKFGFSFFGFLSVTWEVAIDNVTGFCLKYAVVTSAASTSEGAEFICKEFLTTGISLPAID